MHGRLYTYKGCLKYIYITEPLLLVRFCISGLEFVTCLVNSSPLFSHLDCLEPVSGCPAETVIPGLGLRGVVCALPAAPSVSESSPAPPDYRRHAKKIQNHSKNHEPEEKSDSFHWISSFESFSLKQFCASNKRVILTDLPELVQFWIKSSLVRADSAGQRS